MWIFLLLLIPMSFVNQGVAQNNQTNGAVSAFIGGGLNNTLSNTAAYSLIGSGGANTNAGSSAAITAGSNNLILVAGARSFIGAGAYNSINAVASGIAAGLGNVVSANAFRSFIGAGLGNLIESNSPHSFIGSGVGNLIYFGENSFVGGGQSNQVNGYHSVIVGGKMNSTGVDYSVIVGGSYNTNEGLYSFTGGGNGNDAQGFANTLVGGMRNTINFSTESFIGGGVANKIGNERGLISYATLSGGRSNQARASFSVISGGEANVVTGSYGAVAGGYGCQATNYAFAAGMSSKATNTGSFVWCGQNGVDTTSTNNNSFTVRCQGGARFLTTSQTNNAQLVGVRLNSGATAWAVLSDSNAKTGFQPIRPRQVLSKVASLPVRAWEYKHDPGRRYIGPTSQDFQASFGLGDATTINTLDADGVALAAIQGLVEELQERDRKMAWEKLQSASALAERDAEIEDLRKSLQQLKTRVDSMSPPTSQ